MFLDNKYFKWYNLICQNAKSRSMPANVYVERHHIIPKSMGGNNSASNIAKLTAREHYVVHLLLTKCVTPENVYKMMRAVNWMYTKKRMSIMNSREYHRKIVTVSGFKDTAEVREKKSRACKIRSSDPEYRSNLSKALKGRKFSEEHILALSTSRKQNGTFAGKNNPMYGVTPTWSIFSNNHPFAKKVYYDGIEYPSVAQLIKATGLTKSKAYSLAKEQIR